VRLLSTTGGGRFRPPPVDALPGPAERAHLLNVDTLSVITYISGMAKTTRSPRRLADEIGKREPFTSAAQEAYLNLLRTHEHLAARVAQFFKAHGVTPAQYNVLRILRGHGARMRTCAIAADMVTREPDITRLIDRLVDAQWVARTRCCHDRRVVWVELAEAGRRLLDALDGPVLALHEEQLAHLGERKLRTLSRLLFEARNPA